MYNKQNIKKTVWKVCLLIVCASILTGGVFAYAINEFPGFDYSDYIEAAIVYASITGSFAGILAILAKPKVKTLLIILAALNAFLFVFRCTALDLIQKPEIEIYNHQYIVGRFIMQFTPYFLFFGVWFIKKLKDKYLEE